MVGPFVGATLIKFGRRNYARLGFFIMAIAMFCFGSLPFATSKMMFVVISVIGRVLQGVGVSCVGVSIQSIIGIIFPDKLEEVMSKFLTFAAVGIALGPMLGSLLYMAGGFKAVFYI